MAKKQPALKTTDPVTRIQQMVEAGEVKNITSAQLQEAAKYIKQQERKLARESKAPKPKE